MIFSTPAPQTVTRMMAIMYSGIAVMISMSAQEQRVELAAVPARGSAHGNADQSGQQRHRDADEHRRPGPVQDPA